MVVSPNGAEKKLMVVLPALGNVAVPVGTVVDQTFDASAYQAVVMIEVDNEVKLPKDTPAVVTSDGLPVQGYTPIAYSLGQAANDFPAEAKERVIVPVSDGKETCQSDPVVAAKAPSAVLAAAAAAPTTAAAVQTTRQARN